MENKTNLETLLNDCKFKDTVNVDDFKYVDDFKLPYSKESNFSIIKHIKHNRYFVLHHRSMKILPSQPGHYEQKLDGGLEFHHIRKDTADGFKTLKELKDCYITIIPENKKSFNTLIEMIQYHDNLTF